MLISIFSFILDLLGLAWECLSAMCRFGWKLFSACADIGWRVLKGTVSLLLTPFTWTLDTLWDLGSWSIYGIFRGVLGVLLLACLALGAIALFNNLARRFHWSPRLSLPASVRTEHIRKG